MYYCVCCYFTVSVFICNLLSMFPATQSKKTGVFDQAVLLLLAHFLCNKCIKKSVSKTKHNDIRLQYHLFLLYFLLSF